MPTDVERLAAQIQQLQTQLAQVSAQLAQVNTVAKDVTSPYGNVVIHEKRGVTYGANLAEPRRVIDYRARNTTTGTVVSVRNYSAMQLERAAYKFARLNAPSRSHWRGDRWLYGYMRDLFSERGAIVRHHGGRVWSWSAYPPQRREIAGKIAATLTRPT